MKPGNTASSCPNRGGCGAIPSAAGTITRLRCTACTSPGRIPKDKLDPEWRKHRSQPLRRLTAPVAFICPVRRQVRFPLPISWTMGQSASLGRITGPAGMTLPFGHARQPSAVHPPRRLRTACGPFFRAPAWSGRTSAMASSIGPVRMCMPQAEVIMRMAFAPIFRLRTVRASPPRRRPRGRIATTETSLPNSVFRLLKMPRKPLDVDGSPVGSQDGLVHRLR